MNEREKHIREEVASWPDEWTDDSDGVIRDLLAALDAERARNRNLETVAEAARAHMRIVAQPPPGAFPTDDALRAALGVVEEPQ